MDTEPDLEDEIMDRVTWSPGGVLATIAIVVAVAVLIGFVVFTDEFISWVHNYAPI